MWLLVVAALGIVPNGLFLYALLHQHLTPLAVFTDRLALPFALDVFGSTALLAYLFARRPVGPVRWPWFLALTLGGTLCFGIPIYLWLNWRRAPKPAAPFTSWWSAV